MEGSPDLFSASLVFESREVRLFFAWSPPEGEGEREPLRFFDDVDFFDSCGGCGLLLGASVEESPPEVAVEAAWTWLAENGWREKERERERENHNHIITA